MDNKAGPARRAPKHEPVAKPAGHKFGWRISEWGPAVGVSRSLVHELIADGSIKSVKLGASRIVITPPDEFLKSLAEPKTV
ncbi:MAG TPA: hypothetical protein VGM07_17100 [Stellaceae bacterium]|jgi:hypothetical protein